MLVEYKRDLNHNYLVLHGEGEIDTGSYQVRMLIANSLSCLLPCRLQGLDGEPLFYYDITSKQAISAYYEKQKMYAEDIEALFSGIISGMEQMSSFLLNQEQLLLEPEYIYMDLEKKTFYFCCLPGKQKDIKLQFQNLMEYILPKIDHQDTRAVQVGYGIYRKLMEEQLQIEEIKKLLYSSEVNLEIEDTEVRKMRNTMVREDKKSEIDEEAEAWEFLDTELEVKKDNEYKQNAVDIEEEKQVLSKTQKGMIVGMLIGAIALTVLALARRNGYLPNMDGKVLIGAMMILGIAGIFIGLTWKKWEKKRNMPILPIKEKEMEEGKRKSDKGEVNSIKNKRISSEKIGKTEELYRSAGPGYASFIGKDVGSLLPIEVKEDLMVIGKLPGAADVVISLPTVSRIHAKVRRDQGEYYLTDLNSRNGTSVNGKVLKGTEEYCLQNQDEVHFGEAEYIFVK